MDAEIENVKLEIKTITEKNPDLKEDKEIGSKMADYLKKKKDQKDVEKT